MQPLITKVIPVLKPVTNRAKPITTKLAPMRTIDLSKLTAAIFSSEEAVRNANSIINAHRLFAESDCTDLAQLISLRVRTLLLSNLQVCNSPSFVQLEAYFGFKDVLEKAKDRLDLNYLLLTALGESDPLFCGELFSAGARITDLTILNKYIDSSEYTNSRANLMVYLLRLGVDPVALDTVLEQWLGIDYLNKFKAIKNSDFKLLVAPLVCTKLLQSGKQGLAQEIIQEIEKTDACGVMNAQLIEYYVNKTKLVFKQFELDTLPLAKAWEVLKTFVRETESDQAWASSKLLLYFAGLLVVRKNTQRLPEVVKLLKEVKDNLSDLVVEANLELVTGNNSGKVEELTSYYAPRFQVQTEGTPKRITLPKTEHVMRHLASIRFRPEEVLRDAVDFFKAPKETLLSKLPLPKIEEFLIKYGTQSLRFAANATLQDIPAAICNAKPEGMTIPEANKIMLGLIDRTLQKVLKQEERKLLLAFRNRLEERDEFHNKWLKVEGPKRDDFTIAMGIPRPKLTFKDFLPLAGEIVKKAAIISDHDLMGSFFENGWLPHPSGHCVNGEVFKLPGQKYRLYICQAGQGTTQFHRNAAYRGVTVKIFEFENEQDTKQKVAEILAFQASVHNSPKTGKEPENFYGLFNGVKEIDHRGIPFRPFQNMGNCAERSLTEAFIFACQRNGQVELANKFLQTIEEYTREDSYSKFKDAMEAKGGKEPVLPLVKGSACVTIRDAQNNKEYLLPVSESLVHTIGFDGDIPLNTQHAMISGAFTWEKAPLFEVQGSEMKLLRNGVVKAYSKLKKILLEPGDTLLFGEAKFVVTSIA